jgi:glycosyltransferase involved in cell wall biosynthesis
MASALATEARRARIAPEAASICIVGTARNCGRTIAAGIDRFAKVTARFASRRFFIVESDSDDGTVAALEALRTRRPDFQYESCGRLAARMPLRTERIAYGRNRCVEFVRDLAEPVDYVLVADLDGVNGKIQEAALLSCWELAVDWDVCAANRGGRYYDIFALRCPGWVEGDCFAEARQLATRLDPKLARHLTAEARMITIPPEHPPIAVESAFAGLGIYRRDAFVRGQYQGLAADGAETCEHVSFHRDIGAAGGAIYINPRMIAGGSPEFFGKDLLRWLKRRLRP